MKSEKAFPETPMLDWLMLILNRQVRRTGTHIKSLSLEPKMYWSLWQELCVDMGISDYRGGALQIAGPRHFVLIKEGWDENEQWRV